MRGEVEHPDVDHPGAEEAVADSRREGVVIGLAPGLFEVESDGEMYLCTLRGRLRKSRPAPPPRHLAGARPSAARSGRAAYATRTATPEPPPEEARPVRVAPGDIVHFTPLGNGEGVIEEVLPRRSVLSRMRSEMGTEHIMLANLDLAVLVFATRDPTPNLGLLDRYLALTENAHIPVLLAINKVDLGIPDEVNAAAQLYRSLGYNVLFTSATTGEGIEQLRSALRGKTSLLTGPSGVGKSSLMNALVPDARQRTAEISQSTGKGRHTTTGVRLIRLTEGGWLADSAGIRELALWSVPSEALAASFRELRPVVGECLYEDCGHAENEEGCALRCAVAEGRITPERFTSFLRLLEEARAEERPAWER